MMLLLPSEGPGDRFLGRDLGRGEGPSPVSDRPLRTPVMDCKGDPALPSLGTDPPGACCWIPPGSMAGLAVPVLTLTREVVCYSHPSGGGTAVGCVAAVART